VWRRCRARTRGLTRGETKCEEDGALCSGELEACLAGEVETRECGEEIEDEVIVDHVEGIRLETLEVIGGEVDGELSGSELVVIESDGTILVVFLLTFSAVGDNLQLCGLRCGDLLLQHRQGEVSRHGTELEAKQSDEAATEIIVEAHEPLALSIAIHTNMSNTLGSSKTSSGSAVLRTHHDASVLAGDIVHGLTHVQRHELVSVPETV